MTSACLCPPRKNEPSLFAVVERKDVCNFTCVTVTHDETNDFILSNGKTHSV